jgi:hypothetical protein
MSSDDARIVKSRRLYDVLGIQLRWGRKMICAEFLFFFGGGGGVLLRKRPLDRWSKLDFREVGWKLDRSCAVKG